jgi:hypothetical protein
MGGKGTKKVGFNMDRVTNSDLAIVLVFNVVQEDKFSKVQEGMKTREKLSKEEEVVM